MKMMICFLPDNEYIKNMKQKNIIFLLAFSFLMPVISVQAATAPNNLKGRILLQVESKGEAWYVNPKDGQKYYMANGDEAFAIMKTLGVGMSNKDIEKMKTDANFRKKFIGKILLQVESHGEAYYISFDGRYNYLKDGAAAYSIMRKLGLGISNSNLNKITEHKVVSQTQNEGNTIVTDLIVFSDKLSSCTPYKTTFVHPFNGETLTKEVDGIVEGKCKYIEQMPNNGKMECNYTESERIAVAQYYKDITAADSVGTSVNSDLNGNNKVTYTIDGKEVENPLQTAMDNGTCIITGYN
jgi:hypothetical protein